MKTFIIVSHVIPIIMPPLRERISDLPLLVSYFLKSCSGGSEKKKVRPNAMQVLLNHNWPGNVRELKTPSSTPSSCPEPKLIRIADLPAYLHGRAKPSDPSSEGLDQVERNHVMKVLKECRGNKILAARRLKISRSTLYRKLEQFDIK